VKRCDKNGDRASATGAGAVDADPGRGLQVVRMSASALRYQSRPDRNQELWARIVALAQRHRRYSVGMIHLKLRQAGQIINYKRVERLYGLEKLHIRRRRRKKIPVSDRQPLVRPGQANEIWSMDFVFDRIASGRALKCLAIVDNATHEAVAVVPEHTIGGDHLTRIMDGICSQRRKPSMIRTDNATEFTGKAMLTWAHRHRAATDRTRQTEPERVCGIVQRATARRMPERTLVHKLGARPGLASRIQRGKTQTPNIWPARPLQCREHSNPHRYSMRGDVAQG
jgi:Integrase core domain